MTLLVLDIRLLDDFHPADDRKLLQGLVSLWPKLLPYLLSFGVLGLRWIASIEIRSRSEHYVRHYVNWWLIYLLPITFVPLSTIVVGRYADFAPAVWLYAGHTLFGHTLLIALISMRIASLTPDLEPGEHLRRRLTSSAFLAAQGIFCGRRGVSGARQGNGELRTVRE